MQSEVQRYQDRNGHIDHVLENLTALRAAPGLAASLLGLDGDDWTIQPLVVTRHVSPAAFIADPCVPFTVLDDLIDVITRQKLPQPGHAPIGSHPTAATPRRALRLGKPAALIPTGRSVCG